MSIKEILNIIFSIFNVRSLRIVPRQKIVLGVIFLVGLGLLLYQSLLSMQLVKAKALELTLLSQKKLVTCQTGFIKEPALLAAKIAISKNRLNALERNFIPSSELAKFFEDLKGLVSITENRLISLDRKPFITLEAYEQLPFVISLRGYYADIVLLLNKLELYPHLIDVKSLKIQSLENETKSFEVIMEMEAEVFLIKK